MKKIILLLSIICTILITSCSGSDDATSTTDVLLKKIIETDIASGKVSTTNVSYNGKKIISVITERENFRQEIKYTYTEDLITKIESFINDQLAITNIYEYNSSDQLILYKSTDIRPDIDYVDKKEYTHNPNGTISFVESSGFVSDDEEITASGTIYLTDNEVSKVNITRVGSSSMTVVASEYDTKNSLYTNIVGFNKLYFVNGVENKHNLVRRIQTNEGNPDENNTLSIIYSYNSNNYPTNATVSIEANGNVAELTTRQYFY